VQRGEDRVRIRRTLEQEMMIPLPCRLHAASRRTLVEDRAVRAAPPPPPPPPANEHIVKSPIVGTYYDAPKPGDPPSSKWATRWNRDKCSASSSR
jgi:biotin carboxyl carrier protein